MLPHISNIINRLLVIIMIFGLNCDILAQVHDKTNTENDAISFFKEKNFRLAMSAYQQLSEASPQNPLYQYYIGRCLLGLNEDIPRAIDNLRFASVRGDISDSWFYLGQAYQRFSEYDRAVESYKRFINEGKRSEIKKLGVKEMLVLAEEKLELTGDNIPGIKPAFDYKKPDNLMIDSDKPLKTDEFPDSTESNNSEAFEPEHPGNNPEFIVSENNHSKDSALPERTVSINNDNLDKALRLQIVADSLNRLAKTKRADLKETEENEKRSELIREISSLEKESGKKQSDADKLYINMQTVTNQTEHRDIATKTTEVIELKEEINGIKVYQYRPVIISSAVNTENEKTVTVTEEINQKPVFKSPENEFTLNDFSAYHENFPIPLRISFPEKLVYYIQLGAFSKKVKDNSFAGITPVFCEEFTSRGIFKYYAGLFHSFMSANEALLKVKSRGYPDSFIVAFYKDELIPVDKAQQIEYSKIKF